MGSMDEQILRTTKEIVVKFIETGRISPNGFPDAFRCIYTAVAEAVLPKDPPPEAVQKPKRNVEKPAGHQRPES